METENLDKRVIFEHEGNLCVLIPAPESKLKFEEIIQKDVPKGVGDILIPHSIIEYADLPKDRVFRDAWKKSGGSVVTDMPRARIIHMDRIRMVRDIELVNSDVELTRAMEEGESLTALKARRQALRDIPQTFDLKQATTSKQLNLKWPAELPARE